MTSYRLYFLDSASAIAGAATVVEAETDAAALRGAASIFRDNNARFAGFELWDRGRRVRCHVKAQVTMDKETAALRRKLARYRRSLLAVNHPDVVKTVKHMIEDAQARLDNIEGQSPPN